MGTPPLTPAVAIVVATYERAQLLPRLLHALLEQQVPVDHEVVIVDNGTTDDTAQVLADLHTAWGDPRLRIIRIEQNRGPAPARNLGWQSTTAGVIAFTDDDCVPTPDWAAGISRLVLAGVADIVQGRTLPDPLHAERHGAWSRTQRIEAPSPFYETCNIAYRRDVLEQVGGFDAAFPVAAGEDTDLALRAQQVGARTQFERDAVVHHAVWPQGFGGALRDLSRTQHLVPLVRRHPELRRSLYARVFWRRRHARTIGATAVVLGGTIVSPWLGLVLLVAWVLARGLASPRDGTRARISVRLGAQRVIADLWVVLVLVRGSIKYRALLL